jgi:hypothetical protein
MEYTTLRRVVELGGGGAEVLLVAVEDVADVAGVDHEPVAEVVEHGLGTLDERFVVDLAPPLAVDELGDEIRRLFEVGEREFFGGDVARSDL